ncbi:MAP7 domain-containing protein 2-like isoform X1 [Hemiscyllium ocellatum]|uniref:MAP7 domain-containing protein 2-like isoform X1 n=1 Tax=Hemiscyllium ocellatum TaxID=170820 RepID=UPI002965F4EC|nr:MAP7 domain-containing protein 2-like isoform X1 [Hemiscyllium ocellatum]
MKGIGSVTETVPVLTGGSEAATEQCLVSRAVNPRALPSPSPSPLLTGAGRQSLPHCAKEQQRAEGGTVKMSELLLLASPRRAESQSSKADDRQRLAKERREERERTLAVREQQILQKEKRAQLLYERQIEERWKKLEEQRQREEQRRAAVEEKRRQKLEEEKQRHEAMMRRTLERSQQLDQRQKRWSWGGAGAPTGAGTKDGASENTPPCPLGLAFNSPPAPEASDAADSIAAPDKFSVPAANLPRHMESMSGKLLTPSTAANPQPPEKVLTSPQKTNSKSALTPSGDRPDGTAVSPGEAKSRLTSEPQQTEKTKKAKRQPSPGPVSSMTSMLRRSQSPANMSKRSSSPAVKANSKIRTRSPSSSKEFPPSPTSSSKSSPMRRRPSSHNIAESKKKSKDKGDLARQKSEENTGSDAKSPELAESDTPATTPIKEHDRKKAALGEDASSTKTTAGTTNPEEAARLLAERRRHARLQKELEEKERLEQEEAERKHQEELQRREAEETARREEEARKLEEQRRQQELERQRKAEEERILREQQERELLARLEQQREEAEIKAREAAERQRLEREQIIHQIEQERMERKKRIEEIMKRTRRSDTGDTKKDEIKAEINPARNEEKQLQTSVSVEQAGAGLDEKKQEEAPHAQAEAKIVPGLEAVSGNEQTDNGDEQPNSADESTDEPQSMDVSPMSKDDGISIPEFSPLNEVSHVAELEKEQNEPGDAQAVEDLIDLTVHSTYTQLSCDKISLDDCNKNLIEGRCLSMENPLITSLTTSVEETHMQPSAEY